jgi:hypothetical protein
MGNVHFKKLNKVAVYPVKVETRGCHYCKDDISSPNILTCVQCDINIHRYCYYSNFNQSNCTKCPRCSRIGSIGFSSEV